MLLTSPIYFRVNYLKIIVINNNILYIENIISLNHKSSKKETNKTTLIYKLVIIIIYRGSNI